MRAMAACFTLDCPYGDGPAQLASFYAALLGLQIDDPPGVDWATLCKEHDVFPKLAFCGVENYKPPRWPDPNREYPLQAHLDLIVDDREAAKQRILELGGTKLVSEGDAIALSQRNVNDTYPADIYADPFGHAFCVCPVEERSRFWRTPSLGSY